MFLFFVRGSLPSRLCRQRQCSLASNTATPVAPSHQIKFDDGYESTVKRGNIKILDESEAPSPKKAHVEEEPEEETGLDANGRSRRKPKPKQFPDMVL